MTEKKPRPSDEHVIPGLLVVTAQHADRAAKLLDAALADSEDIDRYLANVGETETAQIKASLGFLAVENPHRESATLAESGLLGAPVHAVGYESHASFMSGAGPGPTSKTLDPVDHGHAERVIAVIDSGLADERPSWAAGTNVWHDASDHEPIPASGASHGTFVTSVLRQVAPEFVVSFAAAKPVGAGILKAPKDDHFDANTPTTELDVLGAVYRLVNRHESAPWKVKALNLSLGVIACSHDDPHHLTMEMALAHWRQHMGRNAPIFAAGGNDGSGRPVYPAASPGVRAVAAGDDRGVQRVWSGRQEKSGAGRKWITDVARGVKVVGLTGQDRKHTVWWSGSSFATAIATASAVAGARFEVAGGVTYWHDRNLAKHAYRATFD